MQLSNPAIIAFLQYGFVLPDLVTKTPWCAAHCSFPASLACDKYPPYTGADIYIRMVYRHSPCIPCIELVNQDLLLRIGACGAGFLAAALTLTPLGLLPFRGFPRNTSR